MVNNTKGLQKLSIAMNFLAPKRIKKTLKIRIKNYFDLILL